MLKPEPLTERSEGARQLATLARRHSYAAIARSVGVSDVAVRKWATGQTMPSAARRGALAEAYALPVATWDLPASPNAPERAPAEDVLSIPKRGGDPATRQESGSPVHIVDRDAEELADLLRRALVRIESDPVASTKELAQLATAATSTLRLRARLSGRVEITESQVVRSPAFARVARIWGAALEPYPAAAKAVRDALFAAQEGET